MCINKIQITLILKTIYQLLTNNSAVDPGEIQLKEILHPKHDVTIVVGGTSSGSSRITRNYQ